MLLTEPEVMGYLGSFFWPFVWVRVIALLPFVPWVGRWGTSLGEIVEALRSLRPGR